MIVAGNIVEKDFYQENEWRYVPEEFKLLHQKDFDEKLDEMNKEVESQKLIFTPSEVKYIFVKSDNEIPTIVDFIQNNLDRFPLNDIKILTSRIISLETIARDL